jgi:hypothetical protein
MNPVLFCTTERALNFFGSPVASLYIISLLCIITSYSLLLYTASWFRVITHSNRSSSPGNRLARCASPKSSFRLERRNTPHYMAALSSCVASGGLALQATLVVSPPRRRGTPVVISVSSHGRRPSLIGSTMNPSGMAPIKRTTR